MQMQNEVPLKTVENPDNPLSNGPVNPNTTHLPKPATDGDFIPAINKNHPRFTISICLAFAALYAELIYFVASYYNNLPNSTLAGLVVGIFVLTFGGYLASIVLPHRFFKSHFEDYSPIMFLAREWTAAVVITTSVTLLTLAAGIWAVNGDLGAVGETIRSLALYGLAGAVLLHGILLYVRYVRYLYERELHQSYKIVTIAGVSVVLAAILILYFLPFDLGRMGGHELNAGFLALHLSIRDVGLIVTTLFILFWHFTCLADH
jgi:hypothetical protein